MTITATCAACSSSYEVKQYRADITKFCSKECQNKKQYTPAQFTCAGCGEVKIVSKSRAGKRWCSMECRTRSAMTESERRKKRKHSPTARSSNSSRNLRRWIWNYKSPKCEVCGYDELSYCLDLHHINHNPDDNSPDNIAVLCAICHRKLHKGDLDNATTRRYLSSGSEVKHTGTY